MIKLLKATSFICCLLSLSVCSKNHTQDAPSQNELQVFHTKLEKRYPEVEHISGGELITLLENSHSEVILFDVRKLDEFNVSHLQSAIRISPDIKIDVFLERYRANLKNKKVVFYCSVGERSSKLARAFLKRQDNDPLIASSVFNLKGGIFQWHNEERPIMNNQGLTYYIHPFNEFWGRLLFRKAFVRYKPDDPN